MTDGCVQTRAISRIIDHPNYNPSTTDNDVSLLELSSPIDYASVWALADGPSPVTPVGTLVTVAGWGATSSGGIGSGVAHHVQVPVVSQVARK